MRGLNFALGLALAVLLLSCSRAPDRAAPGAAPAPALPPRPMPIPMLDDALAPEPGANGATVAGAPAETPSLAPVVTPAPSLDSLHAGEDKDPAAPAEDPGYCASEKSEVFHRCDCEVAGKIQTENLIVFKTRADAESTGRRPCKICNP